MHKYEIAVLRALKKGGGLGLRGVMDAAGLGKDETLWAIQNLAAAGLVTVKKELREEAALSQEGNECADRGLPENASWPRGWPPPGRSRSRAEGQGGTDRLHVGQEEGPRHHRQGHAEADREGEGARCGRGMDEEKILKDMQSDGSRIPITKTPRLSRSSGRGASWRPAAGRRPAR